MKSGWGRVVLEKGAEQGCKREKGVAGTKPVETLLRQAGVLEINVRVSKTDVKLKGICKGWKPRLVFEGIWALKSVLEHPCFTFQTLSMAYLTGMLSR